MDIGSLNGRIKLDTRQFNTGIDKASRGLTRFQGKIITLNQSAHLARQAIGMLAGAGKVVFDSLETGAKLNDIEATFSRLVRTLNKAPDTAIDQLKTATRGALTEMQAMAVTTQGLIAGMKFDDLTTSLEYLQKYAKVTDKDFQQLVNTIMTGLARGSVLMLDDAGIIIDQQTLMAEKAKEYGRSLTELEKKHILVGEAIRQMKEKMPALGGELETTYDHLKKIKSYWTDFFNMLKKWSVQGLGAIFAAIGKLVEGFYSVRIGLVKLQQSFGKIFGEIAITVNQKMMDIMITLRDALGSSAAGLVDIDNPVANVTRKMLSGATSALDAGLENLFDKNMKWVLNEAETNQELERLLKKRADIIRNNQANIDMMLGRGSDQGKGSGIGNILGGSLPPAPTPDTFAKNKTLMESALTELINEGALIGLNDAEAAIERIRQQFQAMVELNPELQALYNQLKDTAVSNVLKQQEQALKDQIKTLTSWSEVASDALDGMVDAFTNSLRDMMDSGKFSLSGLMKTFAKELTLYAARNAAELGMIAIKEAVLGLASTAARDAVGAASHFAAAKAAGAGALQMGAFAAGALSGMAHDGMTSIPEDGTWLLKKNERVVDSQTNADLKEYLKDGGKKVSIQQNIEIHGGDENSVMKSMPALKEAMIDAINEDISSGGRTRNTIKAYAGRI